MAKIFDVNSDVHESPNRNTFDLMHKRHMTGKAGVIYPFFCQPVVPSDSFEIDTAIGANLMPMWYPTQSNMRFIVHYFYVPNRLLQKGWKNQIEGLETENFPYLDVPYTYWKTGSLADYLGVPTNFVAPTLMNNYAPVNMQGISEILSVVAKPTNYTEIDPITLQPKTFTTIDSIYHTCITGKGIDLIFTQIGTSGTIDYYSSVGVVTRSKLVPMATTSSTISLPFQAPSRDAYIECMLFVYDDYNYHYSDTVDASRHNGHISSDDIKYIEHYLPSDRSADAGEHRTNFTIDTEKFNSAVADCKSPCLIMLVQCPGFESGTWQPATFLDVSRTVNTVIYNISAGQVLEISDNTYLNPYYNSGNTIDTVKISAFPFRAYDMIYNSYYRNSQGVQPFVVDGQTKYNEYLRTDADGADTNMYELYSRNWELDAYTSCLPSPQQGDAPIISVDTLGRMRIMDEDGTTSTLELRDLDGEQGVEVRNVDIENPEHARLAMRLATSGLTIADFRQGNALQRFLEQSLRSGYRYADFIFGHFGSAPKHQELDMPIFLGGYTQNIDVSKISNVSASGTAPLGEFAGVGASFGGAKHNIKHFFDDYGWVIGVMMLVPDPAYSQILPKPFTYNSRLNWYFPQFSQLGLQPVTYEEVCPIQSHYAHIDDSSKLLTDTFGYQRPNHEYVWLPDTLHGLFRTSLNGSVVNRRFGNRPVLGDNFLKIKPEEVNDIFSLTEENDDIFIAQVVVDIKATRPIPRVVVPSLGR